MGIVSMKVMGQGLLVGSGHGRASGSELLRFNLSQPVASVDEHRVRATHAMGARAPEGQRAILLVLDPVQEVQDPVHLRVALDEIRLPVRLVVALGVVAEDAQIDLHDGAQYTRGLGSNLVIVTGL